MTLVTARMESQMVAAPERQISYVRKTSWDTSWSALQ